MLPLELPGFSQCSRRESKLRPWKGKTLVQTPTNLNDLAMVRNEMRSRHRLQRLKSQRIWSLHLDHFAWLSYVSIMSRLPRQRLHWDMWGSFLDVFSPIYIALQGKWWQDVVGVHLRYWRIAKHLVEGCCSRAWRTPPHFNFGKVFSLVAFVSPLCLKRFVSLPVLQCCVSRCMLCGKVWLAPRLKQIFNERKFEAN